MKIMKMSTILLTCFTFSQCFGFDFNITKHPGLFKDNPFPDSNTFKSDFIQNGGYLLVIFGSYCIKKASYISDLHLSTSN